MRMPFASRLPSPLQVCLDLDRMQMNQGPVAVRGLSLRGPCTGRRQLRLTPDVVLDALEGTLRRAADRTKPSTTPTDDSVVLVMDGSNIATLVLNIKPRPSFCAEYTFAMTPMVRDATDILSAKLCDVEEELTQLRRQNPTSADTFIFGWPRETYKRQRSKSTAEVPSSFVMAVCTSSKYSERHLVTSATSVCDVWRAKSVGNGTRVFVSTTLFLPFNLVLTLEVFDTIREDD
ncbi:Aste57867_10285 [Aphanomyces stellatus]|uniref:Aste57867_10285 protein n=1 Tax=Aphanomyces stellatus TaxID=120398 RepID=A0A485KQG0_9STRA|nr:hypothetical protein As57867_010245 [Aphanomyces stellatus]VFT87159.1 Aste57867_10285 [Aphanomyces stellatus]